MKAEVLGPLTAIAVFEPEVDAFKAYSI